MAKASALPGWYPTVEKYAAKCGIRLQTEAGEMGGALVLLVQTAAMLLRPRGWLAAQGVSRNVLFILALRPMLAAAQTVFQRK